MINIFSSIPIRDPYKVAHPESVVLLARPSIIRICVIVEALVVAVVFVLSFYYTQYDSSTETKITFEALKPPYECSILAPRKDIEDLSPHTSELVAFSSPRYSYEECLIALGGEGLNVCADGNHNDFVLSVFGITSNDDNCEEIFLSDNYRFCLGRENSLEFENGYSTSFLNRDDFDYTPVYGVETYYFVNSNGKISPSTAEFSSIVSDFVVGNNNDIYVLVVDSKNVPAVHRFQQGRQSSDLVLTLSLSISHIYGLAYGSDSVFVLSINDGSKGGSIFKFNTTSGVKTTVNTVVNCSSVFQSNLDLGGEGARYISYGADGNLYVMCTRSTTNNIKRGAVTKPLFPFYQVDPVTLTLRNTFYAPISQLSDVETGSSLASVSQVLNRGSKILFLAGAPLSSLVVGSLQQQAQGELQNLVATGPYFGEYAVVYDTDRVYFAGGVTSERQVYSIASNAFTYEARNFIGEFYFPTRIELGLMYQICSDNITDYQLDASLSTSFYKLCAKSNG
ncbi:hypothetical protein EON65_08775 [archaeon]|nr:MAG: hypothetical protein EON65_08775 [archaeon]